MKDPVVPAELRELASWKVGDQSDRFGSASKAMNLATECGASRQEAWEIGTAVAELASNAVKHGGGGTVSIALETAPRVAIHVTVSDAGPGFPELEPREAGAVDERWAVRLAGQGLGVGLEGVGRLMHELRVDSRAGQGATVIAVKVLGLRHG